ncbi:MAG: SurA N-terminal domain-containing protein [Thermodesulfovibrionales bacterium]
MNYRRAICFLLLGVCMTGFVSLAQSGERKVIAVVDGVPITEDNISVDKEKVLRKFKEKNNRQPEKNELSTIIAEAEQNKLVRFARNIIRERSFKELGITVTDGEVRAAIEKMEPLLKERQEEVLHKERTHNLKIVNALRDALNSPQREREIYELKLKDKMSYETWQGLRRQFHTIEKIDSFEKVVPGNIEDLYRMRSESMKELILDEKLDKMISKDVTMMNPTEKNKRIYEWWKNRFNKAVIDIKDERFRDIREMITESGIK